VETFPKNVPTPKKKTVVGETPGKCKAKGSRHRKENRGGGAKRHNKKGGASKIALRELAHRLRKKGPPRKKPTKTRRGTEKKKRLISLGGEWPVGQGHHGAEGRAHNKK